jgi:hypothetical protein
MINNPMSQMADAQKLTITQLQQALRNGTIDPQVGQIVLASKIKQAKDAKAAMAAQMPKQPPVTQQNLAYGQGVDTLASNLPTVSAAQGGIISFGTGGPVEGYSQAEFDALPPETQQMLLDRAGISRGISEMGAAAKDIATLPGRAILGAAETGITRPLRALGVPIPYLPDSVYGGNRESMTPYYDKLRAAETPATAPVKAAAPVTTAPASLAAAEAKPTAEAKAKLTLDDYLKGGRDLGGAGGASRGAGSQGIGGYKITPYDDTEFKNILASEMNPVTGKEYTYAEKAAERLAEMKALGYNPDTLKEQKADLEKRKEKSAERSKLDEANKWFAMSKAFGEAKPGEGLGTTTGRVLGAYGTVATEMDEKELARQDKIRTEGNSLAIAMNAEAQAQYSGNKAELKEAQNAVKAARANLAGLKVKGVDQQNELAKTIYETQAKKDIAAMQEAGANARYGREDQTIGNLARIIQAAHPEMPLDEVMKEAYRTKGAASIYGADARTKQGTMNEYNDWLKENKFKFLGNKKPPSYQEWLGMMGLSGAGAPAGAAAVDTSGFVDRTKY